jgi:hypothetical protein
MSFIHVASLLTVQVEADVQSGAATFRGRLDLPDGAIVQIVLVPLRRSLSAQRMVQVEGPSRPTTLARMERGRFSARLPARNGGNYLLRVALNRRLQDSARVVEWIDRNKEFQLAFPMALGRVEEAIGALGPALEEAERATCRLEEAFSKSRSLGPKAAAEFISSLISDYRAAAERSPLSATLLEHEETARRLHSMACVEGAHPGSSKRPRQGLPESVGDNDDPTQASAPEDSMPRASVSDGKVRLDGLRRIAAREAALAAALCLTRSDLTEPQFRTLLQAVVDWHARSCGLRTEFSQWTREFTSWLGKAGKSDPGPGTDYKTLQGDLEKLIPELERIPQIQD